MEYMIKDGRRYLQADGNYGDAGTAQRYAYHRQALDSAKFIGLGSANVVPAVSTTPEQALAVIDEAVMQAAALANVLDSIDAAPVIYGEYDTPQLRQAYLRLQHALGVLGNHELAE